MENQDLLNNELQISPASQRYFNEIVKWGKFLAVLGFAVCLVTGVSSFFIPTIIMEIPPNDTLSPGLSSWTSTGITAACLLLAVTLFFPCLYLFKFSEKVRVSIETNNQESLESGIKYLKFMFRFFGILTIIFLSIYAVVFIIMLIRLAMA